MIQVKEVEVDGNGVRFRTLTAEQRQITGDKVKFFKAESGFGLSYDPDTSVLRIEHKGEVRCVHASRVVWWEPVAAGEVPATRTELMKTAAGLGLLAPPEPEPKPLHWKTRQRLAKEAEAKLATEGQK